jgi:hypothetical protein
MPGEGTKTRKSRKAVPPASEGQIDLQEQVERLSSLVASLQSQISELSHPRSADLDLSEELSISEALPVSQMAETEAPSSSEPRSKKRPKAAPPKETAPQEEQTQALEDEVLASAAGVQPPVEEGPDPAFSDGKGPFRPFDPMDFADDFDLAVSSPEPIDWELFAHEEEEMEPSEAFDSPEEERRLYEEMLENHPSLLPAIKRHNVANPPDYVVKDRFWEVVEEREGVDLLSSLVDGGPEDDFASADLPFDQSILDDLLAEAAMAEAAPPEPEPFADFDISGWKEAMAGARPEPEQDELDVLPPLGDQPSSDALESVPALLAVRALALPFRIEEGRLLCRVARPFDEEALSDLREACALPVDVEPYPISLVVTGLRRAYSDGTDGTARADLLEGAAPRADNLIKTIASWIGLR